MKTNIVRIIFTVITLLMVSCAFAGCNSDNASSGITSTVSDITDGTVS